MLKLLVTILMVSVLALAGWGYVTVQKELSPVLEKLKDKDQAEYELMLSKFKGFSFKKGMEIYHHLNNTSKAEFIKKHFLEMREKWREDKDFRKEKQGQETEDRKLLKKSNEHRSAARLADLNPLADKDYDKAIRIRWEGSPAWQKSLVLREKCEKFLNLEILSSKSRLNILNIPRTVTRTGSSGGFHESVAELCEQKIPVAENEAGLAKSLQALREEMNYYYFTEMIKEIGLAKDAVYPQPYRLKRMATDFIDYN